MPNLVIGSVPRGEDLFGRESLVQTLWARLERDNILLVAPRRFGKTGIMYRLLDEPKSPFRPMYINVEHILTAGDFMVELMATILRDRHFARVGETIWHETKEFGRFLRNLPASVDIGGVKIELRERTDVPKHWNAYGDRLMSLLSQEQPQLLLLLDEFAVMIDKIAQKNQEEAQQLLHWFRGARIAPNTRTRFVIGGSINLVSTLDDLGLVDTVNDLSIERLKPFDSATARQFVEAVFQSRQRALPPDVLDAILDLVGEPIPYLLAVVLTAVFDRLRAAHDAVSVETVKRAFEEDLLGGATSVVFQHYRSRIDQYYRGVEGQAAKAILGMLSRSDGALSRDSLYLQFLKATRFTAAEQDQEEFIRLMKKLDNDFYVVAKDHTYDFFSRVLKLWWRTHYGFQGE